MIKLIALILLFVLGIMLGFGVGVINNFPENITVDYGENVKYFAEVMDNLTFEVNCSEFINCNCNYTLGGGK